MKNLGRIKQYKLYVHSKKFVRGLFGVMVALSLLTIPGAYIDRGYFYDDYISGFFFGFIFTLSVFVLWLTRDKTKPAMTQEEYLKHKEDQKRLE